MENKMKIEQVDDFFVLTKKVSVEVHKDGGMSQDHINLTASLEKTFANTQTHVKFKDYKIDKSSIKTEVLNGQLYVVMLAFKV